MTKLTRNRSNSRRGNNSEISFDAILRSPFGLFRFTLHCLLCIAALILGFRLSREALLALGSLKPLPDTLLKSIRNTYTDAGKPSDVALGFPYVKDNPKSFTPFTPPKTTSSVDRKSSRVHVGRHEILIRSWPHPDPVQTFLAHQLLGRVQDEQQHMYGLKERKQLLVITPTYARTFQAVHLTGLVHTLRVVSGPLKWIVVEAGGVSNETAALLVSSQLSYHHLGFHEVMPADSKHRQQLETRLRLEGLRFIGEQQLDGVVLFADDSNTYSSDFFDEAQKVDWIGFFSVGLLPSPDTPALSEELIEVITNQSSVLKEANIKKQVLEDSHAAKESNNLIGGVSSSSLKEIFVPSLALPLQAPVCNSSGHLIGWYLPSQNMGMQDASIIDGLKWAGFALNARIFWKEYKKPLWIKSWTELLGGDLSLLGTPLAFVSDASFVEPLGSCGRDVYLWLLQVEAGVDSKFPSRWVISPPLDVVVLSKRTPWPDAPLGSPPPPPLLPAPITVNQHAKRRSKGTKVGRGKRGSHHVKQGKGEMIL